MKRCAAFVAILLALLASSCASSSGPPPIVRFYDGPAKSQEEIAVLRSRDLKGPNGQDWFGESVTVRLLAIDGIPGKGRLGYGSSWNGAFRIELPPGDHTLSVGYADMHSSGTTVTMMSSTTPATISFKAEPGHEYILDATGLGAMWGATLVDVSTGSTLFPEPPAAP